MDLNKLAELRRIGYKIPRTCGLCTHGVFVGKSDFGGCAIQTYQHLKHTGPPKQLSIYDEIDPKLKPGGKSLDVMIWRHPCLCDERPPYSHWLVRVRLKKSPGWDPDPQVSFPVPGLS